MSEAQVAVSPVPAEASTSAPAAQTATAAKSPVKRQRGVSVLPVARVQRIIKADRDVDICSREATFLISMATELFIKKVTDEAYTNARLDKRKVVQYKDLSRAVQQNEYLEFLKPVVPTAMSLSSALEARKDKLEQRQQEENMILEGTLQDEEDEELEQGDEEDVDAEELVLHEEGIGVEPSAETAQPKAPRKKPVSKKKTKAAPIEAVPVEAAPEEEFIVAQPMDIEDA